MKSLSRVRLLATPRTRAYQAPLSMGFSRQAYSPIPSPGDLPNPGIKAGSPALQADALPSKPPGKCYIVSSHYGNPLQYSCLTNPMDGGAWWAAVHGVSKSRTRPSDFTFTFHFHALEKEMATHSSVVAWRIPGMAEPGGLPSMGLHRVGHD